MYKIIRIDENGEKSIENCVPCLFNNRKEAAHTVYSDRLHQWDSKKVIYWQYMRNHLIFWLIVFECLICENFIQHLIHWRL